MSKDNTVEKIVNKIDDIIKKWELEHVSSPCREEIKEALTTFGEQVRRNRDEEWVENLKEILGSKTYHLYQEEIEALQDSK